MSKTYAIKADGDWYSSGFDDPKVNKGDDVTFDFENTKYGNQIKFETFKINGAATVTTGTSHRTGGSGSFKPYAGGGSTYTKPFPIPLLHGDRAIIRQNALTNAREMITRVVSESITASKVLTWEERQKQFNNLADEVIRIARRFEAYSAGDIERMGADSTKEEAK